MGPAMDELKELLKDKSFGSLDEANAFLRQHNQHRNQAPKHLEDRFPEQILTYYLSGLGNLNNNATRKEYTERAKVMLKVRHMLVEIIKDETRWKVFAGKVKRDNLRRPAFQEEFGRVIAGWQDLV